MKELGRNIADFRKRAGITQEHLAELLHVSVSAVSQWETGKTLPDISSVPVLCHVLNASADELLGIDQEMKEQEIRDIIAEAKELIFHHHLAKAEKSLLAALKRYPNRYDVMEQLMMLYQRKSNDDSNAKSDEDCKKAIQYAERIASECTDENRRLRAKQVLCLAYHKIGEEKKAVEIAFKLPELANSRENMLCMVSSGRRKVEFNQMRMFLLLMLLNLSMVEDAQVILEDGQRSLTEDEELEVLQKFEAVIGLMFERGDYGFFHTCLQSCNEHMAAVYAGRGEKEKALKRLEKSAEHAEATLEVNRDATHKSILFRGSSYGEFGTANGNNMTAQLLEAMQSACYDPLRDMPEFQTLSARLMKTATKTQ